MALFTDVLLSGLALSGGQQGCGMLPVTEQAILRGSIRVLSPSQTPTVNAREHFRAGISLAALSKKLLLLVAPSPTCSCAWILGGGPDLESPPTLPSSLWSVKASRHRHMMPQVSPVLPISVCLSATASFVLEVASLLSLHAMA